MKLITKDVDYAVKTLKFMASRTEETHTVSDLAGELSISLAYLRKILQRLSKKGVVTSARGKSGGFSLNCSPDEISLYDLVLAFQGRLKFSNCQCGHGLCSESRHCLVRRNVQEIEDYTREKFKSLTLEVILDCPAETPRLAEIVHAESR